MKARTSARAPGMTVESVLLDELRPHPRNYVEHPPDQVAHLVESIRANGIYRNIVVARDLTILAGHGMVKAAQEAGLKSIPVRRLDIEPDSAAALKILAGDNEVRHLVAVDDRALSELLRTIKQEDPTGLLGTGYDDMMLANLLMVTRPESEVKDFNAAAEWVGMPEYEDGQDSPRLILTFRGEDDRRRLVEELGLKLSQTGRGVWSAWWPPKEREDLASVRFEDAG